MKDQIKKFVNNNKRELAYYTAGVIVGVIAYTHVCRAYGYEMTQPGMSDENYLYARTITGRYLKCELLKQ